MLEDVIKQYGGIEVDAMSVYSDIFRLGSNEIQRSGEANHDLKANPLGYGINKGAEHGKYRIMLDDTFEESLKELQECDLAILNGITYFGKKNIQAAANKMYALIIDLDGISDSGLNNLLSGATNKSFNLYPFFNYIILSGSGVHLYLLLEEPLPLYPNIKMGLKNLKYALTELIWNKNITELEPQYQGINQGFRVIGGKTKIPGVRTRAFRMHQHPFSIEQLNEYVPEDSRIDMTKIWKESKVSLSMAKDIYPEWYEKRILNNQAKGTWTCKRDLYLWWKRMIKEKTVYGHRYFCILALAVYGVKSGIEREEIEKDARELMPFLNSLNVEEPFTENDMLSALECYDERYKTFPREDIQKLTAIEIKANKRNYRKQKDHLHADLWMSEKKGRPIVNLCRQNRELALQFMRENGEIKGRPNKKNQIDMFLKENPNAKVSEVARELGVSRTTVYKYLESK